MITGCVDPRDELEFANVMFKVVPDVDMRTQPSHFFLCEVEKTSREAVQSRNTKEIRSEVSFLDDFYLG